MNTADKKIFAIATTIYILLLALCTYTLLYRGIDNIPQRDMVSISFDYFGMLIGIVLYICCMLDVQKTGADLKYFRYLLNVTYMGMLTDGMADLLDGIPHLIWANLINNTLHYMCTPVMVYFFWKYMATIIKVEKPFEKVFGGIIRWGMIIMLISHVVNAFTGIYFTVSTDGFYSRSATFPFAMVYMFVGIALLIITILSERKQLERFQTATLLVYVVGALVGVVLTILIPTVNVGNCESMVVLLLMYCLLNIAQGREKVAADKELAMAADIQESILPRDFPYLPVRREFDLYASMTPAKEVGGDFYDFFMVGENHLAVVIGDVSGKGVPASLFMMLSKALIKFDTRSSELYEPGEILTKVNEQLCEENNADQFVTVWLGVLDLRDGKLRYSRAGHEYPIIASGGQPFRICKGRSSLPLGIMEGISYRTEELKIAGGDVLYLYTDGVPEATNTTKEMYGPKRLLEALNENPNTSAREIEDRVRRSVEEFVGDASQFDDMTMLCLRYCENTLES